LRRSGNTLIQEVIEISSSDEGDIDDEDSDDGVRVDIGAGEELGYARIRRPIGRPSQMPLKY